MRTLWDYQCLASLMCCSVYRCTVYRALYCCCCCRLSCRFDVCYAHCQLAYYHVQTVQSTPCYFAKICRSSCRSLCQKLSSVLFQRCRQILCRLSILVWLLVLWLAWSISKDWYYRSWHQRCCYWTSSDWQWYHGMNN